jgi:hypothetical protein
MKHHLLDDNPFALKLSSMPNDALNLSTFGFEGSVSVLMAILV